MSVGASGALFTILGIYGTLMPDSQWSIIFLPMVSFSAENGIYGLMAFDIIGNPNKNFFFQPKGSAAVDF